MTDTLDTLTTAAVVERQKLQRHFGRFDILFFLICTIVGVDTIATVARGGGEAFTWMMVFAVVFFVPQALLFAELGAAFPQEGGPYYWTRLAFGHLAGAVNNFLYWITNPVWIGGTLAISCIGAVQVFFNNGNSVPTTVWYVIALAFVWLSIVAAITSFSVGKWLPTAGAFARFVLLGLFTIELRRSHPDTPRPFRMPAYRPLTVILMVLVAIASVQLIAPGLGKSWFGSDFIPSNWTYAERYTYLWTELLPVLLFIAVGVLFWWLGRRTRAQVAAPEAASPLS